MNPAETATRDTVGTQVICHLLGKLVRRVLDHLIERVIVTGSVAAIVMAPLVPVPSGPFRLDRVGVLAASFAFAWCGWYLLRHATLPGPKPGQ